MPQVRFTEPARAAHGPLIARASAICSSLFGAGEVLVRDIAEADPLPPRTRIVTLSRADMPCLTDLGHGHVAVTYCDPSSEASLALLLAAIAPPGAPLAADPESLAVFALAGRLAQSDIPVLINGATGTGKEVLSRFIHERSERAHGPFVAVNCAALPEAMLEALLFGHQKGAFTGAMQQAEGFMRAADGGTLLLDEIAELPLALQAKLLRALQEGEVVPLGATAPIKIDVRIIACANRDLATEVAEGRFRADLYYRLNVFPLATRALRDRPQDIVLLAQAFVMRHARGKGPVPCLAEEAQALLRAHSWPGNVRELENVIRRALLLAGDSPTIEAAHVLFDESVRLVASAESESARALPDAAEPPRKLASVVRDSEAQAIIAALDSCHGSRVKAARALGISERTLRYRLADLREAGIEVGRTAAAGGR